MREPTTTRRRPRPRSGPTLAGLAALCGLLTAAPASGGAPIREEPAWIRLRSWRGLVGLDGSWTRDRFDRAEDQLYLLEEKAGLHLDGSVYHPGLLTFGVGGEVGLLEAWVRRDRDRDTSVATLLRYDGRIQLLGQHPLSVFALARRTDDQVLALLADRRRVRTGEEQVGVRYRGPFRLNAHVYRRTLTSAGISFDRDETRRGAVADLRATGESAGDLRVTYAVEDYRDRFFGTDYVAQSATLQHGIHFDQRAHRLDTRLSLDDQRGSFDRRLSIANERYRWRVMRELDVFATASWRESQQQGGSSRTIEASGGLTHRLYDSLVTTAELGQRDDGFDQGDERRSWGQLSEEYSKRVPFGRLHLDYSFRGENLDRNADATSRFVLDEAVTLTDGVPAFVENPEADPSSVHVTDAAGTLVYGEGIDYEVLTTGSLVEIRRLPTGGVANGDTVLVDYTYRVAGDVAYTTWAHTGGAQLSIFDVIRIYARFFGQRISYAGGRPRGSTLGLQIERLEQRYGVRGTWRWFQAGFEYEEIDQGSRAAWRGWTVDGGVRLRIATVLQAALRAEHRETRFRHDGRTRIDVVSSNVSWRPIQGLSFTAQGSYERRLDRDTAFDRLTLRGDAVWTYRKLEARIYGWLQETRGRRLFVGRTDILLGFELTRRF